jgi:N-acetylglutamate synthase-like GNAT family acetyltransferase
MKVERLPEDQYDVLMEVEDGYCPDPNGSIVVVARDDGEVVGRMFLLSLAHIEGTWINKQHRNGTLAVRMIKLMEKEAKNIGISSLFAYAKNEEVGGYLERLGYKRTELVVFEKEL